MYHSSTQRRFWTFANKEELLSHRRAAHRRFIQERLDQRDCLAVTNYISSLTNWKSADIQKALQPDNPEIATLFLSLDEEEELRRFYQIMLRDFCSKFNQGSSKDAVLFRSTIATGFALFQRAYINESVMRLHPKHMMITCLWIAVKIDEVHISMEQFVSHLRGDRQKAIDIILNNEPYVMKKLHYHLMIHLPYRAFEGLIIDLKTRFGDTLQKPDRLRAGGEKFLENAMMSDALLLYAPSQIALAAIMQAVEDVGEDLSEYIEKVLVHFPIDKPFTESGDSMDRAEEIEEEKRAAHGSKTSIHLLAVCDEIRHFVEESMKYVTNKDRCKKLETKIETCRDPAFNPETDQYQRRIEELTKMELQEDAKFE